MQRQAFALLLSAVCAVIVTTGSAQAASTTVPVMTANAAGSDNTVVGTLNVHWRRRATCSATLTAEGLRGSLHRGRTASGGGIEWRWVAGASAPGGQWTAAVRCSQGNSHAGASARFLVPRSTPRGRVHQLIRPGSVHVRSSDGYAGKGNGLGSGGGDPYPAGQCTWYAWSRRPDLPWFSGEAGNAKNWISSARARGIPTGTAPATGAIVVFAPGQDGAGYYGHVAYVESVNGSSITIAEANYNGYPAVHKRTVSSSGLHFIYGGLAGHGPGAPVPAPSPPSPTAPAGTYPHHVYHTCANGACGLKIHTEPSLSAPLVTIKNDGDEVFIVCQTTGDTVYGIDGSSSSVWDKLSESNYASDFYIDTPGTNGAFSPPIPRCAAESPSPSPSPQTVTHYNCPDTPSAFGHYVPAGKHWGNDFIAQGSTISGGHLDIGANVDGNNHQASIGIFTGGPDTLSGELGSVTVNVNGYGGVNFTFPLTIHVTPGESLWLVASGSGDFTAYDQNNGGADGCFIGNLQGVQ